MSEDPNPDPEPHNMAESNTLPDALLFDPASSGEIPDMPAVQDHAVQAAMQRLDGEVPESTAQTPTAQPSSDDGWDPAIHESPPRRNREGGWAKLRGKRPSAAQASKPEAPRRSFVNPQPDPVSPGVSDAPQESQTTTVPADDAAIQASAEVSAGLFLAAGVFAFGEDFQPDDKREQSGLVNAFAAYYRASGCPDLPPGLALAAGLAVYTGKRWSRPSVVERRKSIWQWINDKIHSVMYRE